MDPITLALLAMGGSTYLRSRAEHDVLSRRREYTQRERGRQADYGREADAVLGDQLGALSSAADERELPRLSSLYESVPVQDLAGPEMTGVYQDTTGSAPAETRSEIARKIHDALVVGRSHAKAAARLNGRNALSFQRGMSLNRGGEQISAIRANSAGSLGVLPTEYDYAQKSVLPTQQLADALGQAGQFAALYGMTRPPQAKPANIDPSIRGPANFGHGGGTYDPSLWWE